MFFFSFFLEDLSFGFEVDVFCNKRCIMGGYPMAGKILAYFGLSDPRPNLGVWGGGGGDEAILEKVLIFCFYCL